MARIRPNSKREPIFEQTRDQSGVNRFTGIPEVLSRLRWFGELGLPLYVSEFHITLEDWGDESTRWAGASRAEKDAQAAYLRDFLTAFFSVEQADAFVHWTFWEGAAWRRTSAQYGWDWEVRDHLAEYRELVYDRWWTDETGQTDASGRYGVNVFKGTYQVTAEEGERFGEARITVSDGGESVEITIE